MARKYGRWVRLTRYLQERYPTAPIKLTDNKMRKITKSIDQTNPFNIDFDPKPRCSIRRRARDAGYEVDYDPADRTKKIFIICR
jgi:hypothetical protein